MPPGGAAGRTAGPVPGSLAGCGTVCPHQSTPTCEQHTPGLCAGPLLSSQSVHLFPPGREETPQVLLFPKHYYTQYVSRPARETLAFAAAEVTERPSTVSAFRLRRSARLFLVFLIFLCFIFVTFPQGGTITLIFKNKKIEVQEDYALVQPHPWHRARMRFAPRRSDCRSEARERSSPFFNYKATSFEGQGIAGRPPGAPQTLGSHWIAAFPLSGDGGLARCATLSGRPPTPSPAPRPFGYYSPGPRLCPDGSEMAGNREWEGLGFASRLVSRAAW